jgi:hypothetical protein
VSIAIELVDSQLRRKSLFLDTPHAHQRTIQLHFAEGMGDDVSYQTWMILFDALSLKDTDFTSANAGSTTAQVDFV